MTNAALDATPAQNALPCLYTHMPKGPQLIILEFGSTAISLELSAIEGVVRALLRLRPRPALLLLSIHEWCSPGPNPRIYEPGQLVRGGGVYPDTPWARVERTMLRVCRHYGQACVSVHAALEPLVRAGADGFSIDDITGPDCLHPIRGFRGVDYITQVLIHWLHRVRREARMVRSSNPELSLHEDPIARALARRRWAEKPIARCYGFSSGQWSLAPLNWRTLACVNGSCTRESQLGSRFCPAWLGHCACPHSGKRNETQFRRFLERTPSTWFECGYALLPNRRRKYSHGVVALQPVAALLLQLDTRLPRTLTDRRTEAHPVSKPANVRLEHLTSYERMGVAELRCTAGCTCTPQRIDAHRRVRQSVFTMHSFAIERAHDDSCTMEIRLLQETSSGEHKFKVRSLLVQDGL